MSQIKRAAQCLGLNERTLRRWAALGCPVRREGHGPTAAMVFDVEVVREWATRAGRSGRPGRPPESYAAPAVDGVDGRRVYFVLNTVTGNVKVGVAKAPKTRVHQLQVATDCELVLLGTIAGGVEIERAVHEGLAPHHLRGEWFHARCRSVVDAILARWRL